MTAPDHFSRDIVLRCQSLLHNLLPKVDEGLPSDAQFGGPLRTTFLLAMANIARDWPHDLLNSLAESRAIDAARNAPAGRILIDLRNALAHGGIAYLDERGRNTRGQVAMFAFVGTKKKDGKIVGLNVLRLHENDFSAFLAAWTEWLAQTSVVDVLNYDRPIAA